MQQVFIFTKSVRNGYKLDEQISGLSDINIYARTSCQDRVVASKIVLPIDDLASCYGRMMI